MKSIENNLIVEIIRKAGELASVKAIMPTWTRVGRDGQLYAKMPFIGGQETVGVDEQDLETAVNEAFAGFCIVAEKYGLGLEKELVMLGWQVAQSEDADVSVFGLRPEQEAMGGVLTTGDTRTFLFEAPAYAVLAA